MCSFSYRTGVTCRFREIILIEEGYVNKQINTTNNNNSIFIIIIIIINNNNNYNMQATGPVRQKGNENEKAKEQKAEKQKRKWVDKRGTWSQSSETAKKEVNLSQYVQVISSFTFDLGFVHPLQDVALHQCLPLSSVCCFPVPGPFTFGLSFVHPLQDVAFYQCLPLSSVCCFSLPGGSPLPCYVVLPSSAWSSS